MYILGISCFYHDSAAVLIKDGVVIAASEEERFSRIKHDASFPKHAINFCLEQARIKTSDISYVVFYEKPTLKFERIFLTSFRFVPNSFSFFRESMKEWFFDKLWIKNTIITTLNISPDTLLFSEHHLSHMASSFYPSSYQNAALLSIDAVGEWATTSWGIGNDTQIEIKEEIHFPNSLGILYTAFTVFCGYEANEGEYKLMGLAPYGKPKYVKQIKTLFKTAQDGSYELNLPYFSYQYDIQGIYTKKFEELFGKANKHPEEIIPYYADIAASIQFIFEQQVLAITRYIQKKTNLDILCYAGGAALNSKANWRIVKESGFKKIFIQPAAGDSGGALGAALWAYHNVLGYKRSFVMKHAYYGGIESDDEIVKTLKKEKVSYKKFSEKVLIDMVSSELVNGKVIGWVQERAEWGPRALGNRSILADPRSKKMKEIVNKKIKFREGFRPFAPVTLYEKAQEYFDIDSLKEQDPFRFMLYVVPVKKIYRKKLAAITHEDGTARPQFIRKDVNPRYYALIKKFGEKSGIDVLLNTSFNLKGEPMVTTAKQALSTFFTSELDILVINNYVIRKNI